MDEEAGLISVGLSFGGVPATLAIPFAAVTGFADPHVRFGLRFRRPTCREDRTARRRRAGRGTAAESRRRSPPRSRRRWSASTPSAAARRSKDP